MLVGEMVGEEEEVGVKVVGFRERTSVGCSEGLAVGESDGTEGD
jgi:hypothetical protein